MKMNIAALEKSVKKSAYQALFFMRKNSPQILTGAGIAGGITATVMACKATLKLPEVIEEHNQTRDDIWNSVGGKIVGTGEIYTEEVAKKSTTKLYVITSLKVMKLYAPSFSVGALSIFSILYGHRILNKRNASLVAAYNLLDKGFKEYRKNVIERYGEEVDKELRYGLVNKKIEEEETDENGKKKKVKWEAKVLPNGTTPSIYARIFDESNLNYEKDAELNKFFLNCQQAQWNHTLMTRGYVFLNEVYESLGFDPTKAGQHVGWYYNPKDKKSDSYIDFGIYDMVREKTNDFVNGYERSVILDFNVQGPIDCLIGEDI